MVVGDFAQGVQLVVIGGGPGGYAAAIRAAQLGLEVVLVEKEFLGGVCLNWGCIPSKALIHVANLKREIEHADRVGLLVGPAQLDLKRTLAWKTEVVEKLRAGVGSLLASHKVEVVTGTATLTSPSSFSVDTGSGVRRFEFESLILAVGSSAAEIPGIPRDGVRVIDSADALDPPYIPERLAVIGAGAVGLELGTIYAKFGAAVTILEAGTQLLPMMDRGIPPVLARSLRNLGIELVLGARPISVNAVEGGIEARFTTQEGERVLVADKALIAVGRRPNTAGIGLERAGVKVDARGFVTVDKHLKTSVNGIYAIGDMIGGPMLAHKASYQGKVAAEVAAGQPSAYEDVEAPAVIFSDPEIACVGLTEQDAEAKGVKVKIGVFPFKASGRAMTLGGETDGFTKIISDADSGITLGVHIIGPSASDLIAEGCLAVASASHFEDLTLTMHPHPTLPETIQEAAEQIENRAIHIFTPAKGKH
jgi:dihydrolipoamide dehydrogenase